MNGKFRKLLAGIVMAVAMGTLAQAAETADPVAGTWALNLAKSTFTPGPAPKSQTRTYAQTTEGLSLTVTGVAADGSPISQQSTFKYDGKKYPISGSPDYDSLSLTRINGTTVKSTMTRDGKHVGNTTRTLSDHGKMLTLTTRGKNAAGKSYSFRAVFDKQ